MKLIYTLLYTLLLSFISGLALAQSQAPSIRWQTCLGGSSRDYATAVQPTQDGGFIVAGYAYSTDGQITGHYANTSFSDCWIVKLDRFGVLQWQKSFGSFNNDQATAIEPTNDGGYIVAGYASSNTGQVSGNHGRTDYWVVKLNDTGAIQWQKSLGGSGDDLAYTVQQTSDSGYIVAGVSTSNDGDVTGHIGDTDYWVVKLSHTGTLQWQKSLGGTYDETAFSVVQAPDGGFVVAGSSSSDDGDVKGHHGIHIYDYWVVKLSATGTLLWERSLGGSGADYAQAIRSTTDGGYVVAGRSASTNGDVTGHHVSSATLIGYDYWVVKLNDTGAIQWQKSLGGFKTDEAYAIEQTPDGGYIVAGGSNSVNGDVTGNHDTTDYWVVKLNDTGAIQWQTSLGGTAVEGASAIRITSDGGYILAGTTTSSNGDISGNHGDRDYWVVKLGGNPIAVSNTSFPEEVFSIYPNPATGAVHIQSPEPIESVLLTELSGKIAYQTAGRSAARVSIPTMALTNGLYLVQVTTQHGTQTQKLMIQH